MTHQPQHPLDHAIDRVASRLVAVEQDDALGERIVARLPARSRTAGWVGVLLPQAALAICVALVGFVWAMRDREDAAPVILPAVAIVETNTAGTTRPRFGDSEPAETLRSKPDVPTLRTALASLPDHERSLTPVAAPAALEMTVIEAPALLEETPVVVAPIVLIELPLSGGSLSPEM